MSLQPFRLPCGGLIDRTRPLKFSFDGGDYAGYLGDTLASALLANGVRIIGKSPRHRRARGIIGLGLEEQGTLYARLSDGLAAHRGEEITTSFLRARDRLSGFDFGQHDGSGALVCDIAVIGGGAAGMMAAFVAASSGARIALIDNAAELGGWLRRERRCIENIPAQLWAARLAEKLGGLANVQVFSRTTALSVRRSGEIDALAHGDCGSEDESGQAQEWRLLRLAAKQIVVATGAAECPLAFEDNDRPGVMLASSVRGYLNQYAVACGHRTLIATNNDSGYLTALDLIEAGLDAVAIVDSRSPARSFIQEAAERRSLPILASAVVKRVRYRRALEAADICSLDGEKIATLPCDCLAMTGGLTPTPLVSGASMENTRSGQRTLCAPAPGDIVHLAGSCAGYFALRVCIASGAKAGADAALGADFPAPPTWIAPTADPLLNTRRVTAAPSLVLGDPGKAYVDFLNDLTALELENSRELQALAASGAAFNPSRGYASQTGPRRWQTASADQQALYGALALGFRDRRALN